MPPKPSKRKASTSANAKPSSTNRTTSPKKSKAAQNVSKSTPTSTTQSTSVEEVTVVSSSSFSSSSSSFSPPPPSSRLVGLKLELQDNIIKGVQIPSSNHDYANLTINLQNFRRKTGKTNKPYYGLQLGHKHLFSQGKVCDTIVNWKCCELIELGIDTGFVVALKIHQETLNIAINGIRPHDYSDRHINSADHGLITGLKIGDVIAFDHHTEDVSRHRWKLQKSTADEIAREKMKLAAQRKSAEQQKKKKFSLKEEEARVIGEDYFSCKICVKMLAVPYITYPCTRCHFCKSCIDEGYNKKGTGPCQGCAATPMIKFEAIVDEKFKEMILTNYTVGLLNYSDTDTIGGKTGNEMYEEAVSESDYNYLKEEVKKFKKKLSEGSQEQPVEID
ncbi:hypothetical protein TrST_g12994 [Triparma strigata]|uniref:RING-type domain-containing protein n=1 Tax=Triparma strigata TaxID=1606541 RepID=A0A9W7E1B8_9STRA|nr:hypothetical protein TrST_g12994 [Triparma strigata]